MVNDVYTGENVAVTVYHHNVSSECSLVSSYLTGGRTQAHRYPGRGAGSETGEAFPPLAWFWVVPAPWGSCR